METHHGLWLLPLVNLDLADDEVHVWRAALDLHPWQVQQLKITLASDELERAARYRSDKHRQHFIAARGILRTILSYYLNAAPNDLCFDYNHYGKPFLAPKFERYPLTFNLSHSDGLALYAVARNQYVGIDIERIRTDFEYEEIAQRFFSSGEVTVLRTVSAHLKPEAFFSCWTRKEAYIKAQGQGLSLPLDSFDVSLAPGEPAKLLRIRDEPQEASHWVVQALNPARGYVGALAVRQRKYKSKFWQWVNDSAQV